MNSFVPIRYYVRYSDVLDTEELRQFNRIGDAKTVPLPEVCTGMNHAELVDLVAQGVLWDKGVDRNTRYVVVAELDNGNFMLLSDLIDVWDKARENNGY